MYVKYADKLLLGNENIHSNKIHFLFWKEKMTKVQKVISDKCLFVVYLLLFQFVCCEVIILFKSELKIIMEFLFNQGPPKMYCELI